MLKPAIQVGKCLALRVDKMLTRGVKMMVKPEFIAGLKELTDYDIQGLLILYRENATAIIY